MKIFFFLNHPRSGDLGLGNVAGALYLERLRRMSCLTLSFERRV